jgi:hypothetical protein
LWCGIARGSRPRKDAHSNERKETMNGEGEKRKRRGKGREWNADAKKEMSGEGREEGKKRFKAPSSRHCHHKLQSSPLSVLVLVRSALW